ncbi:MAG: hypothetical protein ACI9U2_003301 [Bradymonadia bacterium]|jgi:hypothetical protein
MRALALITTALLALAGCDDATSDAPSGPQTFSVTITNLSDATTMTSGYSPALWVLHQVSDPLFMAGTAASDALESFAEDGVPDALIVALGDTVLGHGVASTAGADDYETAPLEPGETMTFELTADPADAPRLSIAAMVGETNDWFIATQGSGVPLFDADGVALPSRDVTSMFAVWDAGTEADEPFGEGPNQAARQAVRGAGDSEDPAVVSAAGQIRAAAMPVAMNQLLRVEIMPR